MKEVIGCLLTVFPLLASAYSLNANDDEHVVLDHLLHQSRVGTFNASLPISDAYALDLLGELPAQDPMVAQLVSRLRQPTFQAGFFTLRAEAQLGLGYTNARATPLIQMNALVNPILGGNEGRFVGGGFMERAGARLHGQLGDVFHFSVQPSLLYSSRDEFSGDATDFLLEEGLGSIQIRDLVVEGGLGQTRWGVGRMGHLLFSSENRRLWMGRIRSNKPVVPPGFLDFLGPTQFESFILFLGKDYSQSNARLFGIFFSLAPTANLELGFGSTVQFGGSGTPTNNPLVIITDYVSDAKSAAANRNFAFSARYRIPKLGIEPYLELMMEDCCGRAILNDRDFQNLLGVYFPRLDPQGKLDFTFEWARTSHIAYRHGTFSDGLAFKGRALGHTIGPDAMGFYAAFRYFHSPTWLLHVGMTYEIRSRQGKSGGSTVASSVLPSYEVPFQSTRVDVRSDFTLKNANIVLTPSVSFERITGKNYRQFSGAYRGFVGLEARYLF